MSRFVGSCDYASGSSLDPIPEPPQIGDPPPPDTPPTTGATCFDKLYDYSNQVQSTTNPGSFTVTCFTQDYYGGTYSTFLLGKEIDYSPSSGIGGVTNKWQLPYRANHSMSCDEGSTLINHNFYYNIRYSPLAEDGFLYEGVSRTDCYSHDHPIQYALLTKPAERCSPATWFVAKKDFSKEPTHGQYISKYLVEVLKESGGVRTVAETYEETGWSNSLHSTGTKGFWIRYSLADPPVTDPIVILRRGGGVGAFYSGGETYIVSGGKFYRVDYTDPTSDYPRFLLSEEWLVILKGGKAHCISLDAFSPIKTLETGHPSIRLETGLSSYGSGSRFVLVDLSVVGASARCTLEVGDGAERLGDFFIYDGYVRESYHRDYLEYSGYAKVYNNPDPDFAGAWYFAYEGNCDPVPKRVELDASGGYAKVGRYYASCPLLVSPPEITLVPVSVPWQVREMSLTEEYFTAVQGEEFWEYSCSGSVIVPEHTNVAGYVKKTTFVIP